MRKDLLRGMLLKEQVNGVIRAYVAILADTLRVLIANTSVARLAIRKREVAKLQMFIPLNSQPTMARWHITLEEILRISDQRP